MKFRSILRRLAVTSPFFLTAAGILRFVAAPLDVVPETDAHPVLIVTSQGLHPAFRALELWNEAQGCPARVVTLEPGTSFAEIDARLGTLCRREGATAVLLGGDETAIPLLGGLRSGSDPADASAERGPRVVPEPAPDPGSVPSGVRVSRAPVRDLQEAWAFVDACRANRVTLDQLIAEPTILRAGAFDPGPPATLAQAVAGVPGSR